VGITRLLNQRILDSGCYELVGEHIYHVISPNNFKKRSLFRIKPESHCLGRMIKRGYYKNNKSLGKTNDFERAFMGFKSPYLKEVIQIKENNPHIFK
tara:strand:+ start:1751 stop:2041 length:291 start_codon:yes stop_codon:yes gene_type:complete